ncbi:parallel beta-helix domain-containing protein [Microbacterium sp. SS28]|uniref:parallel beta-helix domain-containing protein n=1 Tax=Microbacterium sp. SS28 TaxID=2919948 RepID=UPI001FA995B1|nr:parallel beta-helix domain-containing protein [Microbacterium sp. SS28]
MFTLLGRSIRPDVTLVLLSALLAAHGLAAQPAAASSNTITVTTTIQAAVDAAAPGDTIRVPAGVYEEAVTITTSGLTLVGEPGAVLDGTRLGAQVGIRVRGVSGARLADITIQGFEIRGYSLSGVLVRGVDGFRITGGNYIDNPLYGIFPVATTDGRIDHNTVRGSFDSGIYIGQSTDILIDGNVVHDNTVGIEVELASRVTVRDNVATANSVGAIIFVIPGRAVKVTEDILIEGNTLSGNRRPNTNTDADELLAAVPGGIGVLNVGGDRVTLRGNTVSGNASAGIGVISLPPEYAALDPQVDARPDGGVVSGNTVAGNGTSPDPRLAPFPGGDIVWDGSGTTCFDVRKSASTFPAPLPTCH